MWQCYGQGWCHVLQHPLRNKLQATKRSESVVVGIYSVEGVVKWGTNHDIAIIDRGTEQVKATFHL